MLIFSRDTIRDLTDGVPEPKTYLQDVAFSIQRGIENAAKEHKHSYRWDCREADKETINFIWDLFHIEYNFSFSVGYDDSNNDIDYLEFYW